VSHETGGSLLRILWRHALKFKTSLNTGAVRLAVALLLCSQSLTGCSYFGFYRYRRAEMAPPSEAEKVTFPTSYEKGIHLEGPTMAALEVARTEFMPPGVKAEAQNKELAQCLQRRDIYEVSVLKENDNLFFVSFWPDLSRCNIKTTDFITFDAGATYAIDGRGRVLAVE
jgi:hypothetical protein